MNFDPLHLAALSAVLRGGSFEQAARDLNVTPSAISQRIRTLEDRIGTALVLRGAPCTGTPAGLRLARHAEDVGLLEAQVSRELALPGGGPVTRLRIAVNADSLATWFIPALAAVEEMLFELVIDDQDHSADWLRRGEVSAAVTASEKPVPGCIGHALGSMRYIATASPDFMQHWFPDGPDPESLGRAPCLVFNAKDRLQARWGRMAVGVHPQPPCHVLPSTHAFVDAARAGMGWGMNPEPLVRGPLRNGRLAALLPDLPLLVPLQWQVARVMAPALESLTRAVRRAAKARLVQD